MKDNKLKAIVVDDDNSSRSQLVAMLEKLDDITIISEFNNAMDSISFMKRNECDVVFLDIEMPEMTGIELVKSLENLPQVVFFTSNPSYALECYEYNVTDFLSKPVEFPRLLTCIKKVQDRYEALNLKNSSVSQEERSLFIKSDSRFVKLDFDEILYIEASGDYVIFKTEAKSYIVHSTLKNIIKTMPEDQFIRVHRSYVVNKNKIVDIEDMSLVIGKKVIPISRSQKDPLMNSLNLLK